MKIPRRSNRPSSSHFLAPSRLRGNLLFLLLPAVCATVLWAAPPAWWSDPQTQILNTTNSTEDNYAPANLGQLKHVARQARTHLDATLPGGAGTAIDTLVTGFGGNLTAEQREANYAPINLGQLKAVAKPFYDRLILFQYDTKTNLIAHGYPTSWASTYPWNPATPLDENYAPANIGQLKLAFSFDLSAPAGQLPDWWQRYYFNGQTGIFPNALSPAGDGLTNLQKYVMGLNPGITDSDGDVMPDVYEIANGLNPRINDLLLDLDSDLVPNREDARPNDSSIGRLTITIASPTDGGTIP